MCTIIIYCRGPQYLAETLNDLIDKTPPELIKQIIICDENGQINKEEYPLNDWDIIIPTQQSGKSRAYNQAAQQATSPTLVFLQSPAKFSNNWLDLALQQLAARTIVSPAARTFNPHLWSFENQSWKRYGLRWDFSIYDHRPRKKHSPVAAHCLIIQKEFFEELQGFIESFEPTGGENICLSLKCWFANGTITIAEDSEIGIVPEIETSSGNITRMVDAWFPQFSEAYHNLTGTEEIKTGPDEELDQFLHIENRNCWLKSLQPELVDLYNLYGSATGKTVAVVGDGPSIDYISSLQNYDIIIAVDRVGSIDNLFDWVLIDYVVTNLPDVMASVDSKLVVPSTASDIPADALVVEVEEMAEVFSVAPPFVDFDNNMTLLAVHFALFLGPKSIDLFGFDNKILGGISHTRHYNGGRIWPDSESTKRKFLVCEYGIRQLGDLAIKLNIPLIRIGHA